MSFSFLFPAVPSPPFVDADGDGQNDRDVASGDLALLWDTLKGDADLWLNGTDLATDQGLLTAAAMSLFLDRRAEDDDVPPSGDPRDRRGWWADEFLEVKGDKYGSRLWLLDRSKLTNETAIKAREYVLEAWAWMIEDKVVSSIDVTVDRSPSGLFIFGALNRPGRDAVAFRFAHIWDHMQETT